MGNPERHQPSWDRLKPGEIDFTGAVEQTEFLLFMIDHALSVAQEREGELPDWGARVIARYLANEHIDSATALHQLATTGGANIGALMDDLAYLHFAPCLPPHVHVCVNALAHFLLRRVDEQIAAEAAAGIDRAPRRDGGSDE